MMPGCAESSLLTPACAASMVALQHMCCCVQALHAKSGGLRCWSMARGALHDAACEDAVRAHGLSLAAAAVTLILSLLLVNRQEEAAAGSAPMPSSMVSVSLLRVRLLKQAIEPLSAPAEAASASQVVTMQRGPICRRHNVPASQSL